MQDVLALYPSLPKGSTLVIFDEENPILHLDEAQGVLYQMAYQDDSLVTMYFSNGISVSNDDLKTGKTFVFKCSGGHLTDITSIVKQRPELLLPHDPNEHYRLELSKSEVRSSGDTYVMRVSEVKDSQGRMFNVLRRTTASSRIPFQVTLDDRGQFEFKLDHETRSARTPTLHCNGSVNNWVTVTDLFASNKESSNSSVRSLRFGTSSSNDGPMDRKQRNHASRIRENSFAPYVMGFALLMSCVFVAAEGGLHGLVQPQMGNWL
jgi:hypothetical protein